MTDYSALARFGNYSPNTYGWRIEPDLVPFVFKGVNFGQCARDVLPVFLGLLTELEPVIPGGIAFDLNWRVNPMGNYTNNPNAGQTGAIPYAQAVAIARKYGCEYGGSWSGGANRLGFKDYMHFECHLTPAQARTVKPPTPKDASMSAAEQKAIQDQVHALKEQLIADNARQTAAIKAAIAAQTTAVVAAIKASKAGA